MFFFAKLHRTKMKAIQHAIINCHRIVDKLECTQIVVRTTNVRKHRKGTLITEIIPNFW